MKEFSDQKLAMLLGINIDDYRDLVHKGLKEVLDQAGLVTGYQMQISASNNANLLEKLDIGKDHMVRFTPDYVQRIMSKK